MDNLDALHTSANSLLEYETIEGKHVYEILEHGKIISDISSPSEENLTEDHQDEPLEDKKDASDKKSDPLEPGTEAIGAPA